MCFSFFLLLCGSLHGERFYVDADVEPGGDGLSWEGAFVNLQDALDRTVAGRGDGVWIAAGVYFPDRGANVSIGDRNATFILKESVTLWGGFTGGENNLAERDWKSNFTVLSGEIGPTESQRSQSIVTAATGSVLDGLNVTKGYWAGSDEPGMGAAGVNAPFGLFSARNCTFIGNWAEGNAVGGISAAHAEVTNCFFINNYGEAGGALVSTSSSGSLVVANSVFHRNTAWEGGAILSYGALVVINSLFSENFAFLEGGAIYGISGSTIEITNSTLLGNSAELSGGGAVRGDTVRLFNSILWGNESLGEGGDSINFTRSLSNAASAGGVRSRNLVENGILSIEAAQGATIDLGDPSHYILTDDAIFVDPLDPAGGDGVFGTADDGLRLQPISPVILAGTNSFLPADAYDLDGDGDTTELLPVDLAGFSRVHNGTVDLGAYEFAGDTVAYYWLTVSSSPAHRGQVEWGAGGPFPTASVVELTARPNPGYIFEAWTGDANGDANPLFVTMTANKTITANFVRDYYDDDSDGLTNYEEIVIHGSDPDDSDTSRDGISDGEAVAAGVSPGVDHSGLIGIVVDDPARFGIENVDIDAARQEGIDLVLGDPAGFGLFSEDSIMDLSFGGVVLAKQDDGLTLGFSIEVSNNLLDWHLIDLVERTVEMNQDKLFLRVRHGEPLAAPDVQIFVHPTLGELLTLADGRVLYYLIFDSPGSDPLFSEPSWPLFPMEGNPKAGFRIAASVGAAIFSDPVGSYLTIEGRPVYLHAGDTSPGVANGHGAGSVWWTIRPDGGFNQ